MQNTIEKCKLRKIFVKPTFSYRILNIITPTYSIALLDVNFELNQFPKLTTPSICYVQLYSRLIDNEYRGFSQFFTDGSKKERGVCAAVVWGGGVRRRHCRGKHLSIQRRFTQYKWQLTSSKKVTPSRT